MMNLKCFVLLWNQIILNFIKDLNYTPVVLGDNNFLKKLLVINKEIVSLLKINIMENTLSIIGYGKII